MELTLDGAHLGLAANTERSMSIRLCEDACGDGLGGLRFESCRFDGIATQRHVVQFEGGDIALDLRIGQSLVATQPGLFLGGFGTLDGESFDQRDYWELVYNPEHHHFSRDFVVFTGADMGIRVTNADPFGDPPATRVHLVDRDLQVTEERAMSDDTWDSQVD